MVARVTGALQHICVATAEITPVRVKNWADVMKLATIPDDALLLWGYLHIIEAFDDSVSLTIDVGEGADPDRFTELAPISLAATGVTAFTAANTDGVPFGVTSEVQATFVAGGGDATVGKAVIYLAYVRPNSAHGVG